MEDIQTRELKNCNSIKAVLMLLIILYHSMIMFASNNWFRPAVFPSPIIGEIAQWLNTFHIYAFTLVSGYIFYHVKFERGGYKVYSKFIINKFFRLVIPYVVISVLWVIPIYLMLFQTDITTIVKKFILADEPEQLWFLLMLFWIFVLFGIIAKFFNQHPFIGVGGLLILYLIGTVWDFTLDYFQFFNGCRYAIFFGTGFILRKYGISFLKKIPWPIFVTMDVFLYIVYSYSLQLPANIYTKILWLVLQFMLNLFGAISAFVTLQWFSNYVIKESKLVNFLGEHSMGVYLVHQQLIYFSILLFNGRVVPALQVLFNFFISLSLGLLISFIMSKRSITRIMIGSK